MWPMGVVLAGVARTIDFLLEIYMWIVIARAVLSWVQPNPYNPIVRFVNGVVDPVTYRLSRILPTRIGMVDVAPMILIVAIFLVRQIVVPMIIQAGVHLM
jgi:YggT family protein